MFRLPWYYSKSIYLKKTEVMDRFKTLVPLLGYHIHGINLKCAAAFVVKGATLC